MILLQGTRLSKSFGDLQILKDVSLTVQTGERVGLVGRNGTGKSTLLKILTGHITPDHGEVNRPKTVTLGYLAQDSGLDSHRTVQEEARSVFAHLVEIEKQIRALEMHMGTPAVATQPQLLAQVTEQYTALREEFNRAGGYSYEVAISSVLQGLNFHSQYQQMPVSQLSGGEKTRLALAKLLLASPQLLLLDEPTNYLDLQTLGWLEKYLQTYTGAVLVVSHDRYFLDAITTTIYELDCARLSRFHGNYSHYQKQRDALQASQAKQYHRQQEEIARQRDFVSRNMARASTSGRAKSRLRLLEKITPLAHPGSGHKKINLALNTARPSGKEVIKVQDLAIGYGNQTLGRNINFTIQRGERVALLGTNGTGKTTLLKTLLGLLPPLAGTVRLGHQVTPGYYEQEQKHLDDTKTVLEELWAAHPQLEEQKIRTVLGGFLFRGDEVFKKVGHLSGGERSRLSLAKLICSGANFLLLDEPTNHLDIWSAEALEEALLNYTGTLLFVSHDRYFINKTATGVLELTPGGVTAYQGHYDYYLEKKAPVVETGVQGRAETVTAGKKEFLERKQIQREERKRQQQREAVEQAITAAERTIALLEEELYLPETYNHHQVYRDKSRQLEKERLRLEELLHQWLELADD